MVVALARLTIRVLLAISCALGVTSLIFAAWTVTQTGTQLPSVAVVLFVGALALLWISLIPNTVITAREIPKDQRNPLSTNVALYRRFAWRCSRSVKATLVIVLVLAGTLAATGIVTEAPLRLFGGVILWFYVFNVAMLIALLPEPHAGGEETPAP